MDDESKVNEAIQERTEGFGNPEVKETAKDESKEAEKSSTSETEESAEETKETTDESEETKETKESESEESEEESEEEAKEETEDEEDKPKELGKKTGVQKRIDRLVAEKHQLEERLKALEGKSKEVGEKYYTDAELDQAEKKAIDDNDIALLAEVNKERLRNTKRDLKTAYENDKAKQNQEVNARKQEWVSIVDRYANDDDPSLDIRNQASDLYKLAKAYFEDVELSKEYAGVGGMSRAVADALIEIVRLRGKKKKPEAKREPERKLAKERLKSSLGSGSGEKSVVKKELKPSDNPVDDYIKEREAEKRKRLG